MAATSPIHRDPDIDGDDYGCVGRNRAKGNAAIAQLVFQTQRKLAAGRFDNPHDLVDFVREHLVRVEHRYDCGSCDTVVKENVFAALHDAVQRAGLERFGHLAVYGW